MIGLRSEQRDLNPRPTAPKAAALAKLRYAPNIENTQSSIHSIFPQDQNMKSVFNPFKIALSY